MTYIAIPKEISASEMAGNNFSFSPSQYKRIQIPNKKVLFVREFLSRKLTSADLGYEPGSIHYVNKSDYYFFRTKALQDHSFLPDITSESLIPLSPKGFFNQDLKEGDLIISKDSNIGEIIILDRDYPNCMLSGALYRLPIKKHKYYLLAFIKHKVFREQLDFMVPKSATIRHAKTMFLDCKIPLPKSNEEQIINYVEIITQSIINREKEIKRKHNEIHNTIHLELSNNQKKKSFQYVHPTFQELKQDKRIDAGFFCEEHKRLTFATINYIHGYSTLDKQGLKLLPGPSLEIKLLGTRIDSEIELEGFYRLITPKQIQNYGTVTHYEYIGTPRKIAPIRYGDILFGESGTGRTMVYLDRHEKTINNAHAHLLRPIEGECSLEKAITIRSVLQYYKEIGITDFLTVGGSGGHLSPSYFNRVYIPNFQHRIQKKISTLYHNPLAKIEPQKLSIKNFLDKDSSYIREAGISELDATSKKLKLRLDTVLHAIVNNEDVNLSFDFL